MRTRTNIHYGRGLSKGVEILNNYLPAGRVTVVYDDKSAAENLLRALTAAGYRAEYIGSSSPILPCDGYLIGYGGENALRAAKSASRCCLFPTSICPSVFTSGANTADFAYIDEEIISIDSADAVRECHSTLFSVFTEGLGYLYSDYGKPYADKTLISLLRDAKDILSGKADRDEYIAKTIRHSSILYERLRERGLRTVLAEEMSINLGGIRYLSTAAYFLNRLLILFTKWNFRDMLIPAEVLGGREALPVYPRSELLVTEAELKAILRTGGAPADLKTLVHAMGAAIDSQNPLFAEIYYRGIPEGLIDYG